MSATPILAPVGQPTASARPAATAGSPWIIGAWHDLLLFVGTPAVLIPLVWLAGRVWTAQSLYVVATFGALGHHLPGMMRAYGDRELFARFRTRFVVAPAFLIAVCIACGRMDPSLAAIVLVTYVWGIWHGLMQTHGFLRIYDAKQRSFGRTTVLLDQWMCIAWFGAGVFWSKPVLHHVLQEFYMAGGPLLDARWVWAGRTAWGVLTLAVTAAFAVNLAHTWRAGRRPSPVKLLLLGTSIAFWWYANIVVGNLLIGVLLFELFHDVQYLSIVWVYNRRRVEGGSRVDAFTRYVFRNRAAMMLLYVLLVAAYGALRLVPDLPSQTATTVFTGVLAASALLHFYYDSFIWKVKERGTRAGLGLDGGQAERGAMPFSTWGLSALRWSAFVVPLAFLAVAYTHPGAVTPSDKMLALGRDFPDYALAQHNMAVALAGAGDTDAAIAASRRALALEHFDRGLIADARGTLTWLLVESGKARLEHGREAEAVSELREAAGLEPQLPAALHGKGIELARAGDLQGATLALRAAALMDPRDVATQRDLQRLEAQPKLAPARN